MIPEDKHQKLKRLEKMAVNGADPKRHAEMRNGLAWAIDEIRELDRVCRYQRRQNAALSATVRLMAPKWFSKNKKK